MRTNPRTYERTHPWIRFRLDLSEVSFTDWILLGEAQSKCAHIANIPLKPSVSDELHRVYLAKGAWATTAIEGNTLSERDVVRRMEHNLKLPASQEYLGTEVDNVIHAFTRIGQSVLNRPDPKLSFDEILQFNAWILEGLPLPAEVQPGQLRRHDIVVGPYHGAPSQDCQYLLERLCEWLNDPALLPKGENTLAFALIRAILAHLYIAWIHPFGDGNGRTARLLEFKILLAAGMPTPCAHLLSNHYNQTRQEYYRQLQWASQSGGDVRSFLHYAIQGFVDQIREQIETTWGQQWQLAWRDYVYEVLGGDDAVSRRRRHLVLDLAERAEPVSTREIPLLSPRVAQDYASLSAKTLDRDLIYLRDHELILSADGEVSANREVILGFRAPRTDLAQ